MKQTVMTVVYGVTFVGGRLQVEKQLKDIGVDTEILFKASVYIVQGVFKSLTEIFTTARQIQVRFFFPFFMTNIFDISGTPNLFPC